MRLFISSTFLTLFCLAGYGQPYDIIKTALKDRSNFSIMTDLGGKIPKKLMVLETTSKWSPLIFVLDSVDLDDPIVKAQMDSGTYAPYKRMYRNTYANPYFQTYIFRDTALARKIDKTERLKLKAVALKQPVSKISVKGADYYTVASYKQVDVGYFMVLSVPLFTTDKQYAFVNFDIYFKEQRNENEMDQNGFGTDYFGHVTLAYEKQADGTWLRIAKKDHHIL